MASEATFGSFFRARRMALGKSLRGFCIENGLDPGNVSRLERSLLPPPSGREKLEEYARALELQEGTDEWLDYFDLAAQERGRIPQHLLDDAELAQKLPILFRSLSGRPVPEDQLDELVDLLRGEAD